MLRGIGGEDVTPALKPIIELAGDQIKRARISRKYVRRLSSELGNRVLTVPKIFKNDLQPGDLEFISQELESQLNNVA